MRFSMTSSDTYDRALHIYLFRLILKQKFGFDFLKWLLLLDMIEWRIVYKWFFLPPLQRKCVVSLID